MKHSRHEPALLFFCPDDTYKVLVNYRAGHFLFESYYLRFEDQVGCPEPLGVSDVLRYM